MTNNTFKVACSNCNLRELCMPIGLEVSEMKKLDEMIEKRRQVKQGQMLYASGGSVHFALCYSNWLF